MLATYFGFCTRINNTDMRATGYVTTPTDRGRGVGHCNISLVNDSQENAETQFPPSYDVKNGNFDAGD